jgi:hypothetical protein
MWMILLTVHVVGIWMMSMSRASTLPSDAVNRIYKLIRTNTACKHSTPAPVCALVFWILEPTTKFSSDMRR